MIRLSKVKKKFRSSEFWPKNTFDQLKIERKNTFDIMIRLIEILSFDPSVKKPETFAIQKMSLK
jgi:hypothetical protein